MPPNKPFKLQTRWNMKICHVCLSYIAQNGYQWRNPETLEVACAKCRLSFAWRVRKNKKDTCEHGGVTNDDCHSCHSFKCASMGMSVRRILLGTFLLILKLTCCWLLRLSPLTKAKALWPRRPQSLCNIELAHDTLSLLCMTVFISFI